MALHRHDRGPHTQPASRTRLPTSRRVLLLVDFINPLTFAGGEDLAPAALEAATAAAALKQHMQEQGFRSIFINDNFGQWRSDFKTLAAECQQLGGTAAGLVRRLKPHPDDLMVLKPRHSGFYATPLDLLLEELATREVVVTGLATDFCVMCTAMDAYVRGYKVWVPEDCTAAESPRHKHEALAWMKATLKARISPAAGTVRRSASGRGA
ncbi:cysteine hydrolase [Roseateles sp. SL47]|uniref:cysteine hydrolase family protein n=1 Tax=Roseateles sp. SL47 TaxID=2995138 RepID=UPI0022718257|nr:isochorismatase family cysteine hydrolase [Roseateles sp. SL47]WAC72134.1 cysteine hydrolase [Roseateles sp. SL47]